MTDKKGQNSPKSDNAQPSGSYSGGSFNQVFSGSTNIFSGFRQRDAFEQLHRSHHRILISFENSSAASTVQRGDPAKEVEAQNHQFNRLETRVLERDIEFRIEPECINKTINLLRSDPKSRHTIPAFLSRQTQQA